MTDFNMPPASAGFPARGRWLIDSYMRDLDLTENQAAGLVGNFGFESGGLAVLQEISPIAGAGGRAWPMWTGPRRRAFESWCANDSLDPDSSEPIYNYTLVELRGAYRHTVDALRQTTTVEAAVWSVGQTYERPGGTTDTNLPGYADRCAYARRALAGPRLTDQLGVSPPTPPIDPPYLAAVLALDAPERKLIQVALGVTADGVIGPRTKAALESNRRGA